MKNLITIALISFLSTIGFGQDMYQQKMGEALGVYAQTQNVADLKNAASNFELIANAEPEKWLPTYYQSICYIMMSFSDNEADATTKDGYLEIAENGINKMLKIAPQESEIHTLQAFYYTAKLVIDPMVRGQKYGALTMESVETALHFDANNPRAKQLKLSNKIGTAQFFGGDISQFCAEATELYNVWDNYELKSPFHPRWGKNQVKAIIDNCNEANSSTPETTSVTEKTGNTLTVEISNLSNDNGYIMLKVSNENEEVITQTMGIIKDGKAVIVISELAKGTYSVSYFHDANENNKMDVDKYGKPTESYGFSNNATGFMSAPKHEKTLFKVEADKTILLEAK